VKVKFCLPDPRFPREYLRNWKKRRHTARTRHLVDLLSTTDVLYVTRVQKERFSDLVHYSVSKIITSSRRDLMKHFNKKGISASITTRRWDHYGCRLGSPRRIPDGTNEKWMYVRMALLALVLNKMESNYGSQAICRFFDVTCTSTRSW